MTPKQKRWLWVAFWTALAIVTALMWPWDWAVNHTPRANAGSSAKAKVYPS